MYFQLCPPLVMAFPTSTPGGKGSGTLLTTLQSQGGPKPLSLAPGTLAAGQA